MKNYVSSRQLDKTMEFILQHPSMSDEQLNQFAATLPGSKTLSALKAIKAIDYKTAAGSGWLYHLVILDDGALCFYNKHEQHAGFWKGFLAGVVSTAATSILVNFLMWLFRSIASRI